MTRGRSAGIAVVCALLLYLPWRSIQFDLNGIIEASSVEAGGARLLTPNHLLYRPLGAATLALLDHGGRTRAIGVLQILSALCGGLAVGFVLLACWDLGTSPAAAVMATLLLATSWAHWVYNTDAHYISLAVLLSAAAFAGAARATPSPLRCAGTGILAGLATLAWQANIFLLPALAIGIGRAWSAPPRWRAVGIFAGSASVTVFAGFLAAARVVGHASSVADFVRWGTSYGGGAPLAIWGVWGWDRLAAAASAWLGSLVSVWDGLGLRALAAGIIQPAKLLPQLSLAAVALLAIATALRAVHGLRHGAALFPIGWMLAAFALYLPFIVWWEPFNPKWFVVPNIFVAGALTVAWQGSDRAALRLPLACVAVIACANFSAAVWPRHRQPNPFLGLARCVTQHVGAADLFVVSDWDWFGYATYFYDYAGSNLPLIDRRGRQAKLDDIAQQLEATRQRGGHVYMLDVRAYSEDRARWLLAQTELSVADFDRFAPRPAFDCDVATVVELDPAREPPDAASPG